ncbi:MAG: PAS domain S-box protein [Nitriliruptoraceae bacterium]
MSLHDGAGERLYDSVTQPAAMLDQLPEWVARYRIRDLEVLYCNASKAADLGRTPSEVIGRRLDEVLAEDSVAAVRDHLEPLGPDQPILTTIRAHPTADGTERWIEWVDQWHPSPEGGEVVTVGRDVTEREQHRHRLMASEARFRVAMASAPIGMALIGLDGRFLEVNAALCAFLGRSGEELLGLTTLEVTHPDDVADDLAYGQASARNEPHPALTKRFVLPDGRTLWGLLTVSTVRNDKGEPIQLIGQVVDITEQVEREARLREAAEAEHRAAADLRRLDEVKNAFLTSVSHELRTPLTVVLGMAATLRRIGPDADAATREELQKAMEDAGGRFGALLDDLLDLDRLTRGTTKAEVAGTDQVDIIDLTTEVLSTLPARTRTRLDCPAELRAIVDPTQRRRIVANLVENADKYAPDGEIQVRLSPWDGGGFRLEVVDDGPGIPADERERVFEPFYRAHPDHPQPGTGVGLALVREFARLHGGRTWVEDRSRGAHLVVEIPAPVHA